MARPPPKVLCRIGELFIIHISGGKGADSARKGDVGVVVVGDPLAAHESRVRPPRLKLNVPSPLEPRKRSSWFDLRVDWLWLSFTAKCTVLDRHWSCCALNGRTFIALTRWMRWCSWCCPFLFISFKEVVLLANRSFLPPDANTTTCTIVDCYCSLGYFEQKAL